MKSILIKIQIIAITVFCFNQGYTQSKDTLVDVGQYKLHFNIIEGHGTPILFESGSGNDGTIWKDIIQPIAEITGATVITYDRAGLGKSEIKSGGDNPEENNILDNVMALEKGLEKLGYNKDIILVAHSLGGFYATLFTSRNEKKVKQIVFIDASLPGFYTKPFVDSLNEMVTESLLNQIKAQKIGLFFEIKNIGNSLELLQKTTFPSSVPIIDLVASNPYNPFKKDADKQRWIDNHKAFTDASLNRTLLMINDAGHYAFKDQPDFVIYQIIKTYASQLEASKSKGILLRALPFSSKLGN
jgi:pimeloyl-ACP methyl ester carboxylesterase